MIWQEKKNAEATVGVIGGRTFQVDFRHVGKKAGKMGLKDD